MCRCGMLTHVGFGAGHGGSLLRSFHDCGDVEVRDVHVPCREKMKLASAEDVCALPRVTRDCSLWFTW